MVTWIVPQFAALFKDLGLKDQDFPAMMKYLIDLSGHFHERWLIILITVAVLVVAWRMFVSTKFGRRAADRMKLLVPVFGKLHHKECMARLSRTTST